MNFDQLNMNARIAKALTLCGYTTPTSIQERAIPEILNGKDVIGIAQTGTGKTAAFVLPAPDHLTKTKPLGKPRILILSPTRELATQITDAVSKYGKFIQPNVASLLGGMPYHKQMQSLSRPVDIVVATPGRLMDHMERGRIDLSGIEMFILDEADRMLDMGFIDDVNHIGSHIPKERQTLLFSATVDKRLSQVINKLLRNPTYVDLSNEKLTPTKIAQELYYADSPHHKMELLQHIIANNNIFKAIIFSATKANADRLAETLEEQDFAAAPLHGDLRQNVRTKTLDRLRRGKLQFIVATDVAARGIDISDITHVFNYDLPKFSEDYVHRIGRTGRAGKTGIAISFALPTDQLHVQRIERYINQKLTTHTIEGLEPKKKPKQMSNQKSGSGDRGNRRFGGERSSGFGKKKFGDSNERGASKSFSKPSRFKDSSSSYEKAFNEKPARFKDGGSRSGDSNERAPRRFDSERSAKPARFADSNERAPRRFDSERPAKPARFADSNERAPRRFDSERSAKPSRFGDSKERAPRRFDGERSAKPARFGDSNERAPRRFDSERSAKPARFGDSKERAPRRFDGERSAKPARFGDSNERAPRRFDGERKSSGFKNKRFEKSDAPRSFKKKEAFRTTRGRAE